jgi:hypothetical protein
MSESKDLYVFSIEYYYDGWHGAPWKLDVVADTSTTVLNFITHKNPKYRVTLLERKQQIELALL